MNSVVYLIPTYLSGNNDKNFLAPMVWDVIKNTSCFLVENIKTSRRFIGSLNLDVDISGLTFDILDKRTSYDMVSQMMSPLKRGEHIGVMSEAGLPGLADPGHQAVAYAHRHGYRVVPLPGASAIQTAVIASGFSAQQFTFHGYLPIKKPQRVKSIKNIARN